MGRCSAGPFPTPTALLARALARVAAHEILHLLAAAHASLGLMKGSLGRADLTSGRVTLDPVSREALSIATRGDPGGVPVVTEAPPGTRFAGGARSADLAPAP